jgi:hypothetical protein
MTTAEVKMGGTMGRPPKKLSKSEAKKPKGQFAARIAALISERRWTTAQAAARFGVGEPTVRKWLRAESVPETLDLRRIGNALDTAENPFPDYRMILPE